MRPIRLGLLLVLLAGRALADPPPVFTSWEDQLERGYEICIAEVAPKVIVPATSGPRPRWSGPITCDVLVLHVLRGGAKPGRALLRATFDPRVAPRFLFLGVDMVDQCGPRTPGKYFRERQFAILPLPASFDLAALSGLSTEAQFRLIMQRRLADLVAGTARSTGDLAYIGRPRQIRHIRAWLRQHDG